MALASSQMTGDGWAIPTQEFTCAHNAYNSDNSDNIITYQTGIRRDEACPEEVQQKCCTIEQIQEKKIRPGFSPS